MAIPHDLRVKLRERRNRLYKTDHDRYENELGMLLQWLDRHEYIRGVLAEIDAAPVDFDEWRDGGGIGRLSVNFPDAEAERAKVCLCVLRDGQLRSYGHTISAAGDFNEIMREYTETFVDPLVNYIEDQIEEGSDVLGALLRYKRRVEWFEASDLHALYESDTRHGEASLDAHLRRYLVDQGIDFPFSQPRSPSGEVDVLAGLGSDDPLSLEVKLFLPDASKDRAYVRQGFAQAYRYAADYGVAAGYLLVFNLTPNALIFDVEEKRPGSPPAIHVGDKTIFLISVDAYSERPPASQDRKLDREVVEEAFLLEAVR